MEIEIYTGYYANVRKYLAGGCACIGISVGTPRYLEGNTLISYARELAPTYSMIHMQDEAEYTRLYNQIVLGRLDYAKVMEHIFGIAREQRKTKAVLLCYEKPPKFCHRQLAAKWINSHGEMFVREYGYDGEAAKPSPAKVRQGDMFEEARIFTKNRPTDWR